MKKIVPRPIEITICDACDEEIVPIGIGNRFSEDGRDYHVTCFLDDEGALYHELHLKSRGGSRLKDCWVCQKEAQ